LLLTASLLSSSATAEKYTESELQRLEYSVVEVAKVYHASMAYIFSQQPTINSLSAEKDSLFGKRFTEQVKKTYTNIYNSPFPDKDNNYIRQLLNLMILVMEDNRTLLLDKDIKFKGFIPAIFGFQLSEKYRKRGYGILIKFTNVPERIRNSLSSPDMWEQESLEKLKLRQSPYVLDTKTNYKGSPAVRYMLPVELTPMCLNCHGTPKDNPANSNIDKDKWKLKDKTGFLMEGWKLGELGGGISVTIYMQQRKKYD